MRKWRIIGAAPPSGRQLGTKSSPTSMRLSRARSLATATVRLGGLKPACATQEAIMALRAVSQTAVTR